LTTYNGGFPNPFLEVSTMPIYAYKCESCGHAKDVLQKISDAPLTDCPACGKATFAKQLTAAGFQLKGSGWYVTDFRGGSATGGTSTASAASETSNSAPAESGGTATSTASSSDGAVSGGCGASCACH
jgi:putative FmdB family regulatory protein